MVLLIIFGVTIGAILGTRFRVLLWCQQSFSLAGAWISGGLLWGGLSCRPRQTAVRYRVWESHSQCLQRASFSLYQRLTRSNTQHR